MDNMRGMLIRGAFAMAPVKNILFNNDTIPRADDFNGSWDDLSPGTQKNWEKIAIILESVIESEIWKQASEPIVESTNTQQWWYQCPAISTLITSSSSQGEAQKKHYHIMIK